MIVTFEQDYLRDLYETGKTTDKKHRFQSEVVKRYRERIKTLETAMITLPGVDPRMIANNLAPSEPVHPGGILKEEIEYRGLSQRKLASQMGVSHSILNEVLNGKRPVTAEYALLFEAMLGIDAGIFTRMQADYNMQTARKDATLAKRLNALKGIAASLL
jgi:addiction module HigA family antidote